MCQYAISTFVGTQLRKVIRNKKENNWQTTLIPKVTATFTMILKYDTFSLSLELIFWMKQFGVTVRSCCLRQARCLFRGPGSSVGIATELRAGLFGIESPRGRDFPPVRTGPGAHPASCKMGTGSFPGVKCGRGVLLTTHPLLVPRS